MTPEAFAEQTGASEAVMERLRLFDRFFVETATVHNLVSRTTLDERWARHYLDSAQLLPLLGPDPRSIVDLGSGAGFPGLVLAAFGADNAMAVSLIESRGKKAAFLNEAAERMGLETVTVHPCRIENVSLSAPPNIVTARALAPLPKLLSLAVPLAGPNTRYMFLKGTRVEDELTEAQEHWHMTVERLPSLTATDSTILALTSVTRRG